MGHTRVGRLPKTQRWRDVVAILDAPDPDATRVAAATAHAATRRLNALVDDPSHTYCFWLLTRLASAARRPDFVDARGLSACWLGQRTPSLASSSRSVTGSVTRSSVTRSRVPR